VQVIDRDEDGNIKAVRYEYPKEADYIIRDVVPLLEAANVQLVFYGHSHLWNRFVSPAVRTFWRLLMLVTLRCRCWRQQARGTSWL